MSAVANVRLLLVLFSLFVLSACGGGSAGSSLTVAAPKFTLQCDLTAPYAVAIAPEISRTTGAAVATVIALHGKNGSPSSTHFQTLKAGLNAQGYDVVLPQMPWHDYDWDGNLCEGMSFVNQLVAAEKAAGRAVILLGHSMAGPIVLSYSALSNTTKADAVVVLAPGHYVNLSSILESAHAPSIKQARDMVAAGNGDSIATFGTYNLGGLVNISATANIYLSFHDTDQFPNVKSSLPLVVEPLLWLAPKDDPLTSITADIFGIPDLIPNNGVNKYTVISGDHFTVVNFVPVPLNDWYTNL